MLANSNSVVEASPVPRANEFSLKRLSVFGVTLKASSLYTTTVRIQYFKPIDASFRQRPLHHTYQAI